MPFGCLESLNDSGDRKSFFVITTIFNPASFQSRYDLYHQFANHMKETNAQLITIECIFPSLNQYAFQVTDSKNPYHIQLKSKSLYWMKENLINIAVQRLPTRAKWVCWLDADIHFPQKNWVGLTIKELKKYLVVQVFKKANFLGPSPRKKILGVDYSFGYSVAHGKPIDPTKYDEWYPHPGYGWAMDIDAFRKIGGLPDYDIVGSGDLHFAFSILNRVSIAVEDDFHLEFKLLVLKTSSKTADTLEKIAQVVGNKLVGYVPMTISHYWHGSRKDRQYVERCKILIAHKFNFHTDVTRNSEGLQEFVEKLGNISNNRSSIQEDIFTHFQNRKEDEKKIILGDNTVIQNAANSNLKKHPSNVFVLKMFKRVEVRKNDSLDAPAISKSQDDSTRHHFGQDDNDRHHYPYSEIIKCGSWY